MATINAENDEWLRHVRLEKAAKLWMPTYINGMLVRTMDRLKYNDRFYTVYGIDNVNKEITLMDDSSGNVVMLNISPQAPELVLSMRGDKDYKV